MFDRLFSERGISIERLRALCAVVEAGSYAKAADSDPNIASSFNKQVKDLTGFIGTDLVVRDGKTVKPTEAGLELAAMTRAYFSSLEGMKDNIASGTQKFVVGAGEAVIHWLVFPRLEKLRKAFPSARYEFVNKRTSAVYDGLKDSSIDLGVVRTDSVSPPYEPIPFGKIEFALFVPTEKMGRAPKGSPLKVLQQIPLGMISSSGQFNTRLFASLSSERIEPNVALTTESFPMLKEALKTNRVAAFLPKQAQGELEPFAYQMIDVPGLQFLSRSYAVVYDLRTADIRQAIKRVALSWGMK